MGIRKTEFDRWNNRYPRRPLAFRISRTLCKENRKVAPQWIKKKPNSRIRRTAVKQRLEKISDMESSKMNSNEGSTKKQPLLNKTLKLFMFAMVLANISGNMYGVLLPLYLKELNASVVQGGLFVQG